MAATLLGALTLGPIVTIPLLIYVIHENPCGRKSGICSSMANNYWQESSTNERLLSFYEILQDHYDYLHEETLFYDARPLLSPLSASSSSFPFAVTLITEIDSVSKTKTELHSLSRIPYYIMDLIHSRTCLQRECYHYMSSQTIFAQNPDDVTIFSAFAYHLIVRMTIDREYALIFYIFGIEFECTDKSASREYRKRKRMERLHEDLDGDEYRKQRQLKRDKWSRSSMSMDSLADAADRAPTTEEVFDHWDEMVDRNFETHITHDTLPRLYIELTRHMEDPYSS